LSLIPDRSSPSLRPATAADFPAIRALIRAVRINPLGLDWRHFIVAVSPEGEMTGCGQVKTHGDGSRELASIAVVPEWRGKGVASAIIERLLAEHPGQIYLTCRSGLGSFYERFGFRVILPDEMPPYFRRISRLVRAMGTLNLIGEDLLVMERTGGEA
jgi:N-acetylglutamate synthase-like GNAT family acetyltransferase